jgi:hypothetical protein
VPTRCASWSAPPTARGNYHPSHTRLTGRPCQLQGRTPSPYQPGRNPAVPCMSRARLARRIAASFVRTCAPNRARTARRCQCRLMRRVVTHEEHIIGCARPRPCALMITGLRAPSQPRPNLPTDPPTASVPARDDGQRSADIRAKGRTGVGDSPCKGSRCRLVGREGSRCRARNQNGVLNGRQYYATGRSLLLFNWEIVRVVESEQ